MNDVANMQILQFSMKNGCLQKGINTWEIHSEFIKLSIQFPCLLVVVAALSSKMRLLLLLLCFCFLVAGISARVRRDPRDDGEASRGRRRFFWPFRPGWKPRGAFSAPLGYEMNDDGNFMKKINLYPG